MHNYVSYTEIMAREDEDMEEVAARLKEAINQVDGVEHVEVDIAP